MLYPKLLWPEKLFLLETMSGVDISFKQKVFKKLALDVLLADYSTLLVELNLEGIISLIAHFQKVAPDTTAQHSGMSELWTKL